MLVLALLTEAESYGYTLVTRLQADGLGDIAAGTIYPVLARLERDGLITSREDQHELVTDRSPQAHRPATTRLVRVQG